MSINGRVGERARTGVPARKPRSPFRPTARRGSVSLNVPAGDRGGVGEGRRPAAARLLARSAGSPARRR